MKLIAVTQFGAFDEKDTYVETKLFIKEYEVEKVKIYILNLLIHSTHSDHFDFKECKENIFVWSNEGLDLQDFNSWFGFVNELKFEETTTIHGSSQESSIFITLTEI